MRRLVESRSLPLAALTRKPFGCIRTAPSRRITSPLSITFSMMCLASAAYSAGSPSRGGNGICAPSDFLMSSGRPASSGVSNKPGAMVTTRMPRRERSRAIGSVIPTIPPFGDADAGAIDRAAQSAEGGDGRAHRALDALFIGDVGLDEAGVRAERPSERLALLLVDVGDDDFCAALREQLRSRPAQARRAARYQKRISVDFHYWRLLVFFILSKRVDRSYQLTLALYTLRSQRGKASSVFAP